MMTDQSNSPCPFIKDTFQECTIVDMHSRNIDLAIYYYRGANFEKCAIFRYHAEPMDRERDSTGQRPDGHGLLRTNPN